MSHVLEHGLLITKRTILQAMYALGMDIGGTNTVFGIVNEEGQVLASDTVKTQYRICIQI